MSEKLLTQEQHDFFVKHQKGKISSEVAELLNSVFEMNLKASQIKSYRSTHKIKSGVVGAGSNAKKSDPIGTIRKFHKKGKVYWAIKIGHRKWERYSRFLWKKHYGEVPKDCLVVSKDQNDLNVSLDNLMLLKKSELLILNKNKKLTNCAEANQANVSIVRIQNLIRERSKYGTRKIDD